MTTEQRKANLEATISRIAGRAVEMTIRGLKEFTFAFDGLDAGVESRIVSYFGSLATCTVSRIDEDDDKFTCVYVSVR